MLRKYIVALLLLCSFAFAAERTSLPDFSGSWRLDPIHSTAKLAYLKASRIVITQYGSQVQFEFQAGHKMLSREIYTADGRERPRYSTRIEKASAAAKFDKDQLVIVTRSILDNEGTQQFTETDRWFISPDGKTLTNKMTDGKLRVYEKQPPEPEPEPQPETENDR